MKWVDAPLFAGKTWSTTTDYYFLPGPTYGGTLTIYVTDWGDSTLVVPAGTFDAVAIGEGLPNGPRSGYSVTGTRAPLMRARTAMHWYSSSVGVVQYDAIDLYRLTSFGGPTPVVESTWGRVKALFLSLP